MLDRLLITGAAGGLGQMAREKLRPLAKTLRLSDIADMEPAGQGEEVVPCDLADAAAVRDLVAGCDGIVHFGGVSVEKPFGPILEANIIGVYNLYEAARAAGQPRIVFASSNHTIGYYTQDTYLTNDVPLRPDGLYGVSKCFGEAMASMYHDKFGQETAIVRIGSCFPEPKNHRMLSTWLSAGDFVSLINSIFAVPRLGCPIIWGVSDNDTKWWDNSAVAYLGWRPTDNSEVYRAKIDAAMAPPERDAPDAVYQGGLFTAEPIHEE
ncbi:MAG: NAD(P)-dependent oxidoreductase [Fulvimarina manganoxydans]|uniref:NAD-dependent epimerase/dehydratase family protein n=1 Tax=Fulvimarina manganoxydans TaxID=937218 RepID=UPI00235338B2|nr:NAD(P)-dependent oxidoreductase [Fulvimarina manganoxydans]MCK5933402.1 NAD(P)-dependent oxidoreductase [Fulvimarina manganoxydans]